MISDTLMTYARETCALEQASGRLFWDEETVMPSGAAAQRGEEHAAMAKMLHARRTSAELGDMIEGARPEGAFEQAVIRELRDSYLRATKVPADLSAAIAKATSQAQHVWAKARADEDVASFLPSLKEVIGLRREEGEAIASGGNPYDALLNDYEKGLSEDGISTLFNSLRPRLVALRDKIRDRPNPPALSGTFNEADQLALSTKLAEVFGYDLSRGRIDKAVHPFSSGSGNDVRITTRTNLEDPFNCFYSTIHEVGHAAYEQNISQEYLLTPIGQGASMGVHESQSRIYENQFGRSAAFTLWLFLQMRERFGDFGIEYPDVFYATVNRVSDGFIRTEADEVQYNLHVMLRFDLERALISGDLAVSDLEAAWNDRFEADFGYAVDKPSNGMLQDVHWAAGLFGYFPTYTLGNVYAGCLHQALRKDVPELDAHLAEGDLAPATDWLKSRLQTHGALRSPVDTIVHATGQAVHVEPLLTYLEDKFGEIYGLI